MKNQENKKEERYVSLWDGTVKDPTTPLPSKEEMEKALKNLDKAEPIPELERLKEVFKPDFDTSHIKPMPVKDK